MRLAGVCLALVCMVAAARAEPAADLRFVLDRGLYPIQFLAYCWREVMPDPAFRDIADGWNERNGALFAELEARGEEVELDDDARRSADEQSLAEIAAAVRAQGDAGDYCRAIARLVDGGLFDLDQRDDLELPLKRLLAPPAEP